MPCKDNYNFYILWQYCNKAGVLLVSLLQDTKKNNQKHDNFLSISGWFKDMYIGPGLFDAKKVISKVEKLSRTFFSSIFNYYWLFSHLKKCFLFKRTIDVLSFF